MNGPGTWEQTFEVPAFAGSAGGGTLDGVGAG
jgi:hypothetical protein